MMMDNEILIMFVLIVWVVVCYGVYLVIELEYGWLIYVEFDVVCIDVVCVLFVSGIDFGDCIVVWVLNLL